MATEGRHDFKPRVHAVQPRAGVKRRQRAGSTGRHAKVAAQVGAIAKVRPDAKDMPDRLWETHLAKHDRARASYYNYYTENRWGEAKNYDLCLNAAIGQDACAQLIVQAAKAMEAANQE